MTEPSTDWLTDRLNDRLADRPIDWLTDFSLHTLASPSDRNVNYDEKQLTGGKMFVLFLLSVQVS